MPHSSDPFHISAAISRWVIDYPELVSRVYIALSMSLSRIPGLILNTGSHGFISEEMRGYRGVNWCFSLVLNKQWVRLYVRTPELSRGFISAAEFQEHFPSSEVTSKGEIALNILEDDLARSICGWIESQVS